MQKVLKLAVLSVCVLCAVFFTPLAIWEAQHMNKMYQEEKVVLIDALKLVGENTQLRVDVEHEKKATELVRKDLDEQIKKVDQLKKEIARLKKPQLTEIR